MLSRGVLSNTVGKLRKALGQATDASEPIETVPGRGYRWRARATKAAHPEHVAHGVSALASLDTPTERFVGRRPVREQLAQVIARAARGRGQLILIAGEAGIGKTRTMRELAAHARERGFSAWEGAAHDGASPPYRPWVEVLRAAHAELSPANWRRHLPLDAWAIALLSPELCDAPRPTEAELDLQSRRFKLFDEVARLLPSASAARPRLVLLDDLHWADSATIELLAYAARALQDCAVILAASLRNDVLRDDHHAAALRRLGGLALHIPLLGLSSDEVAELILAVAGWRDLDPRLPHASCAAEFAEYVCALTEGDLDAADDAAARCRATAKRSQLVSLAILAELMRARRALGDGRLEDLEPSVNRL